MMHAKLTCKTGPLAGNVYYVDEEAVIGSAAECTIQVRSGVVSPQHIRLLHARKPLFDPLNVLLSKKNK